ncbi:MAG: hypothetical protein ABIQ88_12700 [Chitinophagaceae bacterium]
MKRTDFLKQTLKIGGAALLAPYVDVAAAQSTATNKHAQIDAALLERLVNANDKQVDKLLAALQAGVTSTGRKIGFDFATLTASYFSPGSTYHQSPLVVAALEKLVQLLTGLQSADGTLNFGNLESPPDTAFLVEPLAAAAYLLQQNSRPVLKNINEGLKEFLIRCGAALSAGGVHTPNHRWLICSALAGIHTVYPNQVYINRIDEWLGESIYIDADGHYPERSANYAVVENTAFLTVGRLLKKALLFEPVRKNLAMTWYYMEPDGQLITVDSRRQDQYTSKTMVAYYLQYRWLAIKDNDRLFAGITRLIEGLKGFEEEILNKCLFQFLENPLLQQALPDTVDPPVQYEKLFTNAATLRLRHAGTTATLFGGVDWPVIIASGRSDSPNFYTYRKGAAILKYMRLSADFFSMGYFYSDGLKKENNAYTLHKKLAIPYYQPLPANRRNSKGDYKLSPSTDGRFWSKMDFENRPVSNVKTLETKISFTTAAGADKLVFEVTGQAGVRVTIELCFLEGGVLSGVLPADKGNYFLENGMGVYEYGGSSIQFGPGVMAHKVVAGLEGERYSTHFGSLRTEGMHVYLTGITPFKHALTVS